MSPCAGLHTQLAAVMESLVHAAVAELKKLVEDSSAFVLRLEVRAGEKLPPPVTLQAESREKMVRSRATAGDGRGSLWVFLLGLKSAFNIYIVYMYIYIYIIIMTLKNKRNSKKQS